jgi:hypothetical protein
MSATWIAFSLRKKNGPRKTEMFYMAFDCYHLNPAQTWTLSVLPGPALGPGWVRARPRPMQTSMVMFCICICVCLCVQINIFILIFILCHILHTEWLDIRCTNYSGEFYIQNKYISSYKHNYCVIVKWGRALSCINHICALLPKGTSSSNYSRVLTIKLR